jgi:hypothetical protein
MNVYDDDKVDASIDYADQAQNFWWEEPRKNRTDEELRDALDELLIEDGHILCDKPSPFLDLDDFTKAVSRSERLKGRTP